MIAGIKHFLFILTAAALPLLAHAETRRMNLSEALRQHMVTLDAVNFQGNYTGQSMRLLLTGSGSSALVIKVDLGAIFVAADSSYQPMLLAGGETINVQPGKETSADVMTFCGNAPRRCPSKNLHFAFSHVAGDTLTKVLKFIKDRGLFDYLGQSAVWAITNGNPLSDIYDVDRPAIANELIAMVMKATGRPKPEYFSVSNRVAIPDEPAYVPKPLQIIANFELLLDAPKVLTLGVFNEQGEMIQKIFEDQSFGSSGHRFSVEFESADVAPGRYYIRLKEGAAVLQEKTVKIE